MQRKFLNYWQLRTALFLLFSSTLACNYDMLRFGTGGRYEEGREQFLLGRAGNMDTAVDALESVVSQDPTYKSSLTYLGRAYYRKGRYQDAYAILQRALALDKDDEIAWIALGLTQMRLAQDEKGMETLKGAIPLASKVMVDGYKNYSYWDTRGLVRASIRRSALLLAKGLEEKANIIQETDRLLAIVDSEDNFQRNVRNQNYQQHYGTR